MVLGSGWIILQLVMLNKGKVMDIEDKLIIVGVALLGCATLWMIYLVVFNS